MEGTMTVGELIAKLSEFNLDMEVLVKSFKSKEVKLTLFEGITEVKREGLCKGDGPSGFLFYDAVVITPTFDNREDPLKKD
jgi:hypothetical protein